jgi:hypothetical protein
VSEVIRVERKEMTHSWASDTSPVMAEKPRNGTLGSTTFSTRKQSIQSSPGFDSSMESRVRKDIYIHALYWILT